MTFDREALRARATGALRELRAEVLDLALDIYNHPELSGEETRACKACAELLAKHGFTIEPVKGVPTAFVATNAGTGAGPTVGLLAEYDALPGLGHACGHHMIAGSAVGAGLALAAIGTLSGTVKVFGCPAEELGAGKIEMLAAGAFEGVDYALTFHGDEQTGVMVSSTGINTYSLKFHGRPAHAANDPWMGASALDGAMLTMNNVNALRQFVPDGVRMHGYLPHGGEAGNVIVEHTELELSARATDPELLARVSERLLDCARAGAMASGTELTITLVSALKPVKIDPIVGELVCENIRQCAGVEPGQWAATPSTDFGDVSQEIPSVLLSIQTWPQGTGFHNPDTTAAGGRDQALEAMLTAAEVMALTAVDLISGRV